MAFGSMAFGDLGLWPVAKLGSGGIGNRAIAHGNNARGAVKLVENFINEKNTPHVLPWELPI